MSQQSINLGTGVNTNTGDTVRVAFDKANSNFTELFAVIGPNLTGGWSSNTVQSVINLGNTTTPSDSVRTGFTKINNNFSNVFAAITANAVTGLANISLEGPQETINLGAGANTNTGDTVRTAFAKVNDNFSILYQSIIGTSVNTVSQFGPTVSSVNRVVIPVAGPQITQPLPDYFNITADSYDAGIQLIDLGDGADTQTGDPIRVAFAKSNHNFEELYQVFGSNGQSNLIANSVLANNISLTSNLRAGNIYSRYAITTDGNIVASGFFYPNGVAITGGTGANVSSIQNGTSNVKVYYNSNVGITAAGTTWQFDTTGNLVFPSGALIGDTYGDGGTGFQAGTDGSGYAIINSNDRQQYIQVDNNAIYLGTNWSPTTGNFWTFTKDGVSYLPGNLLTSGNIQAGYFLGNGSQLTGIVTYTNANVASYLPVYSGNINAAYYFGNGSALTSINGANITGIVANAAYTLQSGQANYANTATYVTGLTGTNVNVALGYVPLNSNATASTAQYVTGNAQPNITSVGVLSNLTISGNLIAGNISATNFKGNAIPLGSNSSGQLVSNAVTLTNTTTVTDAVAQLNYVLGKLVPSAPPTFPAGQSLTISTLSTYRMCNFTQTDNTIGANKSVAAGTSVANVRRANSYTSSTITNVGPGDSGTVTAYRNSIAVGNVALNGNSNGTYGNLVISNNQDYHNVVSNVTAGFWYSFSASLSGVVQPGWNEVYIGDSSASGTNVPYWYYDASAPGTPTWSNTSIALTTNSSTYSSTIPHLNSSSAFTLYGNVAKLSGDMFPSGASSSAYAFVTGAAGGAIAAPASVTYAGANITWPLVPNLYVSSGSAYLTTTAAVIAGFGSSSTGPSLTADNSYATGAATFNPGVTVLYKTGTASAMEETSITFGSTVGTGSGLAARVLNPGSTDTPSISGNTAFNSQTSTLQTYDATIVAGTLKNDTTNYSTGYLPVGPNLSGQAANQYFTFKFARTSVSKFDIRWSGTIAGLWVALPGSTIDTTSTLNGWLDLSVAYAGAGVPGAGSGGNGSNGAALGGTAPLNSLQTNKSITATFGTVSSSSTASNEIFVRIKLTSGQSVTALSLQTASN